MKKKRRTEAQIVFALRQAESGTAVSETTATECEGLRKSKYQLRCFLILAYIF